MKSAVINGASGLLGSAVLKLLLDRGIPTLLLYRPESDPAKYSNDSPGKFIKVRVPSRSNDTNFSWISNELLGISNEAVFFNFGWGGVSRLTDGTLEEQFTNATSSSDAVVLAKRLGCIKFVNCGSVEENFMELHLSQPADYPAPAQSRYALAKLTSREMCQALAYFERIDYVHTRMSVPVPRDLRGKSFVSSTLRSILEGSPYPEPKNKQIFDIVLLDEVAESFLAIGTHGKNKSDYYIGTSTPSTLTNYFDWTERLVSTGIADVFKGYEGVLSSVFNSQALLDDTGYKPGTTFPEIVRGAM